MNKFHALTVREVRRETPDAVSIAFDIPEALKGAYNFQQGQYLTLKARIGTEELRRSYSICSGIDEGEIRIAIKKVDGGRFSTFANENLRAGTALDVMTPAGRFTTPLDAKASRRYLAFAAGSGITPVLSILKSILSREPESRFDLFYGNRTASSIMFREELEDLKNLHMGRLSVYHILSREKQDVDWLNGHINGALISETVTKLANPAEADACFLCGPAAMVTEVGAALKAAGAREDRIHHELFAAPDESPVNRLPSQAAAKRRDGKSRVTVVRDGKRTEFAVDFDGETIVDTAIKAGIDLPYSCKAGVCSTCRCQTRAGKVQMDKNYSLEEWELKAGYVLACQAHPDSEEVVLDFDEM